jgi:6-phosphogluconolactonase (cycloisomerase 2 family)
MMKIPLFIFCLLALVLSAGCGSSNDEQLIPIPPIARLNTFLVNADMTGGLGVYTVDPVVGTLTEVAGSPFATGTGLNTVLVHPNGRFVYGGSSGAPFLEGFTLDPASGALTAITGFPISSVGDSSLLVDRTGEYLYVFGETEIDGFRVNPVTGALTRLNNYPLAVPGLVEATTQALSANDRFVYLADRGSDQIFTFELLAETGFLALRDVQSSLGAEPSGVGLTPDGRFLYVAHQDGTLTGFTVENNGGLTPLVFAPTVYANGPTISYKFAFIGDVVYVGDAAGATLNAFSINNNTGALTGVAGFPRSGGGASAFAFPFVFEDLLYVPNGPANLIEAYTVNANGSVTPVPGSPFPGNGFPTQVDAAIVSF